MYRLVIVDDEAAIRRELKSFPWAELDIEVVGVCENAVSAYEKIISEKVDIVITDIKMPLMDGFKLIERVKEKFKDIYFVVLSGYYEYEYMREAVTLGIDDYILKPIDFDEMRKSMLRIIELLKSHSGDEIYKRMDIIKHSIEKYRKRFFFKLFTKSLSYDELLEGCDICEIDMTDRSFDLAVFKYDHLSEPRYQIKVSEILSYVQINLSAFLENADMGFAFYDGASDCAAAVLFNESNAEDDFYGKAEKIREYINSLGTVFNDTLSFAYIRDIKYPTEMWQYIAEMKKSLLRHEDNSVTECKASIVLSDAAVQENRSNDSDNNSAIANDMIKYINEHYSEQIKLSEIAKKLFISSNYASTIFKSVTGKHFIDYLISVRISHSKELLLSTGMNISEIGEKVGYAEPSYFCQVFKRVTGLSPKQFRDGTTK